jgi:phosphatidylserine decarboxylase
MSITASIRKTLVPIHPEGYIFIVVFALIALALGWVWQPLGFLGWVMTLWCVYFFRDPPRTTPIREGVVISPADGRIDSVGFFIPPAELGLGDAPVPRISVFMNVFDCHVNRMPVSGRITKIAYRPGLFLSADMDKASDDNERNGLVIETAQGNFGVVQIAGMIARRILCFSKEGQSLNVGERIGLIRFGSRVDVYMPQGAQPLVSIGQKAVAGETVLADFNAKDVAPRFNTQ